MVVLYFIFYIDNLYDFTFYLNNFKIIKKLKVSIKLMHGIDHLEVFFKNRQKGAEG